MMMEYPSLFFYSIAFYRELKDFSPDKLLEIAKECSEISAIHPVHIPDIKAKHKVKSYDEKKSLSNHQVLSLFITSLYLLLKKVNVEPIQIEDSFPFIRDVERFIEMEGG